MDNTFWGNIICGVGAILMIIAGVIKKRERILTVQCFQFGIMGLGNLVLGGISGAISNAFSIIRNFYCLRYKFYWWLGCIFVAAQTALTVWMNDYGILGWLPVVATAIFTFVINSKNDVVLKSAIIVGEVCWGIYDLSLKNYVSVVFDISTIISNFVGILMLTKKKDEKK